MPCHIAHSPFFLMFGVLACVGSRPSIPSRLCLQVISRSKRPIHSYTRPLIPSSLPFNEFAAYSAPSTKRLDLAQSSCSATRQSFHRILLSDTSGYDVVIGKSPQSLRSKRSDSGCWCIRPSGCRGSAELLIWSSIGLI